MQMGLTMLASVLTPKEITDEFGPLIAKQIVKRTRSGLDVTGAAFKKLKDGGTSRLYVSGDMTSAVRYNPQTRKVYVPKGSEHVKAHVHHYGTGPAYKLSPKPRRWFGLSADDVKELDAVTATRLEEKADKAVRAGALKKRGRVFTGRRYWKRDVAQ